MEAHAPVRVLLVDADETRRWTVRTTLEHAGYAVLEAAGRAPALEYVRASQQALVAVLALVPEAESLELVQHIASEASTTQRHAYLLLTARRQTYPLSVVSLFRLVGVRVLQQPFAPDALTAAIAQAACRLGERTPARRPPA